MIKMVFFLQREYRENTIFSLNDWQNLYNILLVVIVKTRYVYPKPGDAYTIDHLSCVKKIEMTIVPQIEKNHYYYKVSKQNLSFPLQIDFKEAFKIHILHIRSSYFRIDDFS